MFNRAMDAANLSCGFKIQVPQNRWLQILFECVDTWNRLLQLVALIKYNRPNCLVTHNNAMPCFEIHQGLAIHNLDSVELRDEADLICSVPSLSSPPVQLSLRLNSEFLEYQQKSELIGVEGVKIWC